MYSFINFRDNVHRLIPSKFPPITLFDWADSAEELELEATKFVAPPLPGETTFPFWIMTFLPKD